MLEVALGGYLVINSDGTYSRSIESYDVDVFDSPTTDPIGPVSFNLLVNADETYVLLQKRELSIFSEIDMTNLTIKAIDSTNGREVEAYFLSSEYYLDEWKNPWANPSYNPSFYDPSQYDYNPSSGYYDPIVIVIKHQTDYTNLTKKVSSVKCFVSDSSDNSFINFKVNITNNQGSFHYLYIKEDRRSERNSSSQYGNEIILKLSSDSSSYLIVSPYEGLNEVSSSEPYDFSYPLGTIFYKRQNTYNEEEYVTEITSYSNGFLQPSQFNLFPISKYHKCFVLLIDKHLYNVVSQKNINYYIIVEITGKRTGIKKQLKIRFIR